MKIIIKNLTKEIDNNIILDNINLGLEGGKIYGFIGRNGSGKSMLFKTICGFIKPTSGSVVVNGVDLYEKNEFPKETSALIDSPKFITSLSGFENLKLIASIQNKIDDLAINNILTELNLFAHKDKKVGKYSLGMIQKLGIAQVLMEDPKMIILDEPFNGLEEESVKKVRNILLAEKKKGKLILIASHIIDDIDILADQVIKLDGGKIVDISIKN